MSTGDLAEALRFVRTDEKRRTLTSITRTKDYFLPDEDPLLWAQQVLRPQPDGSWALDD